MKALSRKIIPALFVAAAAPSLAAILPIFPPTEIKVDELSCKIEIQGNEDFLPWKLEMPIALVRQKLETIGEANITLAKQEMNVTLKDRKGQAVEISAILESYHAIESERAAHFRCVTVKFSHGDQSEKLSCAPRPADPFNDPTGAWAPASFGADGHPRYVIKKFQYDLANTPVGDLVFSCQRH